MSTKELAEALVAACRKGEGTAFVKEHYADDAKSIEPMGDNPETVGKEGILGKHAYFNNAFEVHSMELADPQVAGKYFSTTFIMDSTNKQTNERAPMQEVAVYEVKDGKIVCEQFFY